MVKFQSSRVIAVLPEIALGLASGLCADGGRATDGARGASNAFEPRRTPNAAGEAPGVGLREISSVDERERARTAD